MDIALDEVTLLDMPPSDSVDNAMHCRIGQAKSFANLHKRHGASKRANLPHLLLCHLRAGSLNSHRSAALGHHVLDIVDLSSKEQMIRVHATGVVALVTNTQSIRNIALVKFPGNAMGQCYSVPFVSKKDIDSTVSGSIERTRPVPTSVCFLNVFPKSDLKRLSSLLGAIVALRRAIGGLLLKTFTTGFAVCHASKCNTIEWRTQWTLP